MSKRKPAPEVQPKDPRQIDIEEWLKAHEKRHEMVAKAWAKADEVMTKRKPAPEVQPTTEKLTPKLAWFELCKLYAEGDKLWAEGNKLYAECEKLYAESRKLQAEGDKLQAEGDKLQAEGSKLYAEGSKLRAEGSKLRAEGRLIFNQAVIDHYGPKTTMHWTPTGCTVEGREYKYEEPI